MRPSLAACGKRLAAKAGHRRLKSGPVCVAAQEAHFRDVLPDFVCDVVTCRTERRQHGGADRERAQKGTAALLKGGTTSRNEDRFFCSMQVWQKKIKNLSSWRG